MISSSLTDRDLQQGNKNLITQIWKTSAAALESYRQEPVLFREKILEPPEVELGTHFPRGDEFPSDEKIAKDFSLEFSSTKLGFKG